MGQTQADTLNALIVDVTMPALIVSVLAKRDLEWSTALSLVPASIALFASGACALLVMRALGHGRAVQGGAALVASFCNTGFLGFPLLLALYPGNGTASSTALMIDTVCTTLLLWTVGLALAHRFGNGAAHDARAIAKVLFRPLTLSIVVGLALRALDVHADVALPAFVDSALNTLGHCTSPLVFLSLGLQLDVAALRGRVGAVAIASALKLVLAPVLCLVLVRLLSLSEPVASVTVLQCAMPTAMASVIVVARGGCDRAFAAGVATVTTVLCVATLPAMGWLLDLWR
jgi:predicted permease